MIHTAGEMARRGVTGFLSVTPYYNKPTQEGLYQHYKAFAESTSLPIIVYSVPGRTGVNVEPATIARLSQIPNIVGIKEASGNVGQMCDILRLVPSDFLVLSGDDALTLPLMAVGGRGTLVGPVIGAVFVNALKSWATRAYPDLWLIIMGLLFILVVLFLPGGIVSIPGKLAGLRKRKANTLENGSAAGGADAFARAAHLSGGCTLSARVAGRRDSQESQRAGRSARPVSAGAWSPGGVAG